jgi:hypothetical protein
MRFLANQERDFVFEKVSETDDEWGVPTATSIPARGLVSLGTASLVPGTPGESSSSSARFFLKGSYKDSVKDVKVDDRILFDGEYYSVSKVDVRGTLPGMYKLRFEGVKKK